MTENTRVSYPINHIEKIDQKVKGKGDGPDAANVNFLSPDAFGVLPPVSILTPEQTKYYFLSGSTAVGRYRARASLSPRLPSALASARLSSSCTPPSMLRSW